MHGQTTDSTIIKRDVTIQKDYVPTIQDAGKINTIPSVLDPEVKTIDVQYSPYSTIMDPLYQIRALESARLKTPPIPVRKDGFLRLGAGSSITTLADFMYPLLNKPEYRLDINANHKGVFTEKKHHQNQGGIAFRRYREYGEFMIDATYGFEGFNYYGKNSIEADTLYTHTGGSVLGKDFLPTNAAITRWNMTSGYKTIPSERDYNYSINGSYSGFSAQKGLTEQQIRTHLTYDKKIDENKAGIDFQLQNLFYNNSHTAYPTNQFNYSVFRLNPFFTFEQSKWKLRMGVKTIFSKKEAGKGFVPTADIAGEATLVNKSIFAYGGITGDYQANTMQQMVALNKYGNLNEKIKDSYTPFDIYGGLKIKLLYNFLIDMSVRQKSIKNQHFFINETVFNAISNAPSYTNSFTVNYYDATVLNGNIRINYNYNQVFGFSIGWKYNAWKKLPNGIEAWHIPKHEFDFETDMKLTKKTTVNLNTYIATGREIRTLDGTAASLDPIIDINLGLYYAHSSKVSSFLKINNLANSHYELWNGYEVIGFNAMLGLAFSF